MHGGSLWLKDPLAILADGAERGVVVREGRIAALVPAGQEPEAPVGKVFDASRHVLLPGLVNTHHHFYQTLTRALPAALGRELFPWLEALYPVWARLTPEALDAAATVAMAELLLSGCTTTTDHHYVFPAGLEDAIGIEVAAARRLGIRAVVTRGSMNRSRKDGGLPPDGVVQDEDAILADSERLITRHHDPAPHAMVQVALAPCSPFSVTTSLMQATAALAERAGVRLHTHLAETEGEDRYCLATYGCSPLDYLEACGWLHGRTWLAHGIHFGTEDIARLGRAGVAVGLGVDGSGSNDASNLMQEVRAAFLVQRGRYRVGRVGHRDALRWATEGSAACLGRAELGRIAPGAAADFALFTLDGPGQEPPRAAAQAGCHPPRCAASLTQPSPSPAMARPLPRPSARMEAKRRALAFLAPCAACEGKAADDWEGPGRRQRIQDRDLERHRERDDGEARECAGRDGQARHPARLESGRQPKREGAEAARPLSRCFTFHSLKSTIIGMQGPGGSRAGPGERADGLPRRG